MRISIDGGALCAQTEEFFGTSIFSQNLITALSHYDNGSEYLVYSFCNQKKVKNMRFHRVRPRMGYMKLGITLRELIYRSDIFLALNQALPSYSSAKIISFCHGLSYLKYPDSFKNSHHRLSRQLEEMIVKSDHIITSSRKVTKELHRIYPGLTTKITSLPFGVPFDFQITNERKRKKYFLYVGSNARVKNIEAIVSIFDDLKQSELRDFNLYLVGPHDKYKRYKNVRIIKEVTRQQLRRLYSEACAFLTTSLYESYNLPVVEAISQNCPVIGLNSAIIEEFKPYVYTANNITEMKNFLIKAAQGKMNYNYSKKINENFSWLKYVNGLKKVYEAVSHSSH